MSLKLHRLSVFLQINQFLSDIITLLQSDLLLVKNKEALKSYLSMHSRKLKQAVKNLLLREVPSNKRAPLEEDQIINLNRILTMSRACSLVSSQINPKSSVLSPKETRESTLYPVVK
jgi:hypothetical protein